MRWMSLRLRMSKPRVLRGARKLLSFNWRLGSERDELSRTAQELACSASNYISRPFLTFIIEMNTIGGHLAFRDGHPQKGTVSLLKHGLKHSVCVGDAFTEQVFSILGD